MTFALSLIGMMLGGLISAGGARYPDYGRALEGLGAAVFVLSLVLLGLACRSSGA